jgi:hypothetical protein
MQLQNYQRGVDSKPNFPSQVSEARAAFSKRNTKRNATFIRVRQTLAAMCAGAQRCMYCEDSVSDEVEHHHPKNLYPGRVFDWDNYLYSCGPCNGPKNNKFAVLLAATGALSEIPRPPRGAPPQPPPAGQPALIDPRTEDPLAYLQLDIVGGTFRFAAIGAQIDRGTYTIRVLGLNTRPYLLQARSAQYQNYKFLLDGYVAARNRGDTQPDLKRRIVALLANPHPTVWREMQRQHLHVPELRRLFADAPEALGW